MRGLFCSKIEKEIDKTKKIKMDQIVHAMQNVTVGEVKSRDPPTAEEIVANFRRKYPKRHIFSCLCNHAGQLASEEGYDMQRVGQTPLHIFAVEENYSAMNIVEWLLDMDRTTMLFHQEGKV